MTFLHDHIHWVNALWNSNTLFVLTNCPENKLSWLPIGEKARNTILNLTIFLITSFTKDILIYTNSDYLAGPASKKRRNVNFECVWDIQLSRDYRANVRTCINKIRYNRQWQVLSVLCIGINQKWRFASYLELSWQFRSIPFHNLTAAPCRSCATSNSVDFSEKSLIMIFSMQRMAFLLQTHFSLFHGFST